MPIMPRLKTKARDIAYKILGTPANIKYKPNKFERYINKRLLYDETYRVR